ncbi:hypothetical protein BH24ACT7_BH24ACT7_24910 [soil metagenome]
MGANSRSTVGTATDANAMLRIVFSRLGQPHIGSPNAFSFNVPSVRASGAITIERGAGKTKTVKQTFTRTGGMCTRCEGRGTVSDIDLTQLFDDSKSIADGAITIPGYKADGWWTVRIYTESGFLDPNKPIRKYTRNELHDFPRPADDVEVAVEPHGAGARRVRAAVGSGRAEEERAARWAGRQGLVGPVPVQRGIPVAVQVGHFGGRSVGHAATPDQGQTPVPQVAVPAR